jgi:hypothetical protein
MIAKKIFNWDGEKETDWVVNFLVTLSFVLVIGTSIGLYVLVLPSFLVIQDLFKLNAINSTLSTIYSI